MRPLNRSPSGLEEQFGPSEVGQPGTRPPSSYGPLANIHLSSNDPGPQIIDRFNFPKPRNRQPLMQPQASFGGDSTIMSTSLLQTPPSAMLPLPPLASMAPCSSSHISPHAKSPNSITTPFRGLSRTITNDDLALQDLRRDYEELGASYAQAMTRIADLDQRALESNTEVNALIKQRKSLQAKIEVLESEIEELQLNIEEAHRQGLAKDAQYSQIIDTSSKLQNQAMIETQQHTLEKDRWTRESDDMQRTICDLRSEAREMRRTYRCVSAAPLHDSASFTTIVPDEERDFTTSFPAQAQTDISILKQTNADLEEALAKVRQEHSRLVLHIEKLGDIGRNIQEHLRIASSEMYDAL